MVWIGCLCAPVFAQENRPDSTQENLFVDGIVVDRKKYSFTVQGPDKEYTFSLNPLSRISARLIRPKFDWNQKTVTVTIPMSAPDGRAVNNQSVQYKLPSELHFRNRFESRPEQAAAISGTPIELRNFSITPSLESVAADGQTLTGRLKPTTELNIFETEIDGTTRSIRPQLNVVRLDGFTIMELQPDTTEVFVNYDVEEGMLVARNIEFVRLADRSKMANPKLPRCLVIGDSISFNYFAPLHRLLRQEVNLFHPHANCQGSANYTKLHRWLGAYRNPAQQWDVVVFNFGHDDSEISKRQYQANFGQYLEKLKATKAKLIWVDSTPVPYGFNDPNLSSAATIPKDKRFDFEFEEANAKSLLPGRMRLQNQWAAEVLKSHPEIIVCPAWQVVKQNPRGLYDQWWFGKKLNFKYPQAQPIARELAKAIRIALKK